MDPREYFKEVARELEAVRAPEDLPETKVLIDYLWNLWERNISTDIAARMVIAKFGVGEEKNLN